MRKSILNLGVIVLLLISVFACNEEQEYIKTSDKKVNVNVKSEINQKIDIAYRTDEVTITDILTSQDNYINKKITDDYKYYEVLPERKDSDWFHDNFAYLFEEGTEMNEWVINNIDLNKILIFGLTVNDTKVASLVFSDGLTIPVEFENKRGLILDTNMELDCGFWCSMGTYGRGPDCHCWTTYCCGYGLFYCDEKCPDEMEVFDILDKMFPDNWGLDFELLREIPVHTIKIGESILQY